MHMKPTVAVLRGGPSEYYEDSLKTGAFVLERLPSRYAARDIFIDRSGIWHLNGFPVKEQQALQDIDVVWNALHGKYGEDGKVQRVLEDLGIAYTGSDPVASALCMNRKLTKEAYSKNNIPTFAHLIVEESDEPAERENYIFFHFYMPVAIRPASGGSQDVSIARYKNEIAPLIERARAFSKTVIVETHISGKDVVSVVIDDFRNHDHYVPIPLQVKSVSADAEEYEEVLRFNDSIKNKIIDAAINAHKALAVRHYSQSRMKVTEGGKVYLLETDSTPVLHENSATILSMHSVGVTPEMFIDHLINLALS